MDKYPDFIESTGYGTGEGLCGWNCYHSFSPFIPGVSVPTYTAEQLEEINRQENTPKEYQGKQYTAYQATQRQRRLETQMRAERQKIHLLQVGGADEKDITSAKCRYRATSAEYARFSKAMDLPQQRERVTIDGLGDVRKTPANNSAQNNQVITNFSRELDLLFDTSNMPDTPIYTPEEIYEELCLTQYGKDALKVVENLPQSLKLDYETTKWDGLKGEEHGGKIFIYIKSCKDLMTVACTIIHECTHYKYGIGNSQWAECVCIYQELLHRRKITFDRDYLTIAEKRTIIRAVKEAYDHLNWKKGGTVYGRPRKL